MRRRRVGLIAAFALVLMIASHAPAEERRWALTLYGGRHTDDNLGDFVTSLSRSWEDSYLVILVLARELGGTGPHLRWEVEGQIGRHFSRQDHWELNAVIVGRWLTFPWDRYVDTSVAVGGGLSYATEVPALEAEHHRRATRLLSYLMFELELSLPRYPEWALVGRIHHRSGVFGLFDGVRGGSNVVGVGVRYRF